jgi:hypothetical protein
LRTSTTTAAGCEPACCSFAALCVDRIASRNAAESPSLKPIGLLVYSGRSQIAPARFANSRSSVAAFHLRVAPRARM